jgi:hypothetical protein
VRLALYLGPLCRGLTNVFMSCRQNRGQYRNIKAANDSPGHLKFMYFCMTATNQNGIYNVKSG